MRRLLAPLATSLPALVVLCLMAPTLALPGLDPTDPQETDSYALGVHLPGIIDQVVLKPADPRSGELAAAAPAAANGLFTGHLHRLGWRLDLVWDDQTALGVLADPAGARWVTVEEGVLVPFSSPGLAPEPMATPLRAPGDTGSLPLDAQPTSPKDGVLQIRLDGDEAFVANWGEDWRGIQLAIIHLVSAIYHANLGFPFEVVDQQVVTFDDPHPDRMCAGDERDFLVRYAQKLEDESPTVQDARESAHLFVGYIPLSGYIGCAYISQLDTRWAYAASQVRFSPLNPLLLYRHVVLTAHEIGHNFGGLHHLAIGTSQSGCFGATIMWANLCGNSPVFSGFEQVPSCRAGLLGCNIVATNAPRMYNYAAPRI